MRGLPESSIIAQLGGSSRDVRDTWGVTKEAMAGIIPKIWAGMGSRRGREPGPNISRGRHTSGA